MADTYDHAPQVWTAGQLRHALAAIPDETPVHVGVADGPGNFIDGYEELVLVHAEPVERGGRHQDGSAAGPVHALRGRRGGRVLPRRGLIRLQLLSGQPPYPRSGRCLGGPGTDRRLRSSDVPAGVARGLAGN
ncbi:DUF6225 family protein [Streptomyces sp. NPDC054865]